MVASLGSRVEAARRSSQPTGLSGAGLGAVGVGASVGMAWAVLRGGPIEC